LLTVDLELEHDVGLRHCAAQQRAAVRRAVDRLDRVRKLPLDHGTLAVVTDSRPARPPDRHVAGLGELQQAGVLRAPFDRQTAAYQADVRALSDIAGGRMRGNA